MNNSFESQNLRRGAMSGLGVLLPLAVLLVAPAAFAQATVSTFALPLSATVTAASSGLPEAVIFSGTAHVTATVSTDPTLPPQVVVAIDGRGITGVGQTSGLVYKNECEANLTRPLAALDVLDHGHRRFRGQPRRAADEVDVEQRVTHDHQGPAHRAAPSDGPVGTREGSASTAACVPRA